MRSYKRLTDLVIEDEAVKSLDNVQAGDCIVCFSKQGGNSIGLFCPKKGPQNRPKTGPKCHLKRIHP